MAATVLLDNTTTKTAIQAEFTRKLIEYLNGIAFEKYEILYNRISFMLLDISGVIDYTSLTVNGGTENITIAANQVPILESAEKSEAESVPFSLEYLD